ncbi:ABC transporter permease [Mesorhizobium sp. M1E.F.Ca.ET.045.02.1.1]|uniref:ABC transporter permease n=1 Tax=unclassified Mesorhizobium TaxID=325217 RepID=UPI000F751E0C|nr:MULTISPECIES: ABC transporter permease [unclassified Mesorhizobium]RWD92267.1 MAG: ABC transporter permease subunit [Mesorhizobium sp.]AZO23623.1 ABC transporter permease [Mesorhizobium sp. M1E.F.Ca.ET.045.02.1.1]RUW23118.1 ABC transporter permease subunit [Mesorhizobium sp. M1E.F.Ca.ET.041.01.1.1]RUW76545.1 ABC transporter permease subunit [Mesorhizobium sp. M1E.F.Ca.ET.063.01.1.1]TIV50348.1 MAG: ABC transporter permease subunit [Mesorhizobium sp.]
MAAISVPLHSEPNILSRLIGRPTSAVGLTVLVIIVLAAILAPVIAPYAPSKLSIASRLHPPSLDHLFGTDDLGRDVFTRMLYAARTSLSVGFAVVILSSIIGTILGLTAGYFKRLDTPVSRLIDAMMAFPDILLAIALVAALGATATNVVVALGVVYAPRIARVVRASTLVIRELPYVEAARALGVPTPIILIRHVLRNVTSPLLVQGTFIFANAILAEAGLSFLGVGISPDIPTWGTMIATGRQYMDQAPWVMMFPGAAIVVTVLSLQLLGDGLRDLLDPRLAKDI